MKVLHALSCTFLHGNSAGKCLPHQDTVVHRALEIKDAMVSSGGSGRYFWKTQSKPVVYIGHVKVACKSAECKQGFLSLQIVPCPCTATATSVRLETHADTDNIVRLITATH